MPALKLPKLPRRRLGAPSLKDRAATLKATASRVLRRRETSAAVVEPTANPRLVAMVEEWQRIRALMDAPGFKDDDGLVERFSFLHRAIFRFEAETVEDMQAKLPVLRVEPEHLAISMGGTLTEAAYLGLLADIQRMPSAREVSSDAVLIALGREFDALHAAWRLAEDANREPAARRRLVEDTARAQGLKDEAFYAVEKVAWHLPGVAEAHKATDDAFEALEPVSREIFAAKANTAAGVAIKARAVIPAIWGRCNYEDDANDPDEEWDRSAVRQMIEAACAAAGVDWRGEPITPSETNPKA